MGECGLSVNKCLRAHQMDDRPRPVIPSVPGYLISTDERSRQSSCAGRPQLPSNTGQSKYDHGQPGNHEDRPRPAAPRYRLSAVSRRLSDTAPVRRPGGPATSGACLPHAHAGGVTRGPAAPARARGIFRQFFRLLTVAAAPQNRLFPADHRGEGVIYGTRAQSIVGSAKRPCTGAGNDLPARAGFGGGFLTPFTVAAAPTNRPLTGIEMQRGHFRHARAVICAVDRQGLTRFTSPPAAPSASPAPRPAAAPAPGAAT